MKTIRSAIAVLAASSLLIHLPASAALEAPRGSIVERNIDLAAEKAFDQWMGSLESAPHADDVQNIGILKLAGDTRDFTSLLAEKLTASKRFHVVILSGGDWNAIEDEMARQDVDAGFGDIMNKATIMWTNARGAYVIPETTKGADALLLGRVRDVDGDWLRARARITMHLARVDTRTQVAGGIAEGESVMSIRDLAIYFKVELLIGAGCLVVAMILLALIRGFFKGMSRPR
ncbi:MAG: hypothetical protein V1929_12335 [bacterium]